MIYSLAFALLCTWSDFACWVFKKNHLLSIMFHIVIKDTSLWFSGKMVLSFWITIKKDCWAILHLQTVNFIKQWEVFWSLLKQTLCQFWVSSWQWTFVTVKHNKFIKYDKVCAIFIYYLIQTMLSRRASDCEQFFYFPTLQTTPSLCYNIILGYVVSFWTIQPYHFFQKRLF